MWGIREYENHSGPDGGEEERLYLLNGEDYVFDDREAAERCASKLTEIERGLCNRDCYFLAEELT